MNFIYRLPVDVATQALSVQLFFTAYLQELALLSAGTLLFARRDIGAISVSKQVKSCSMVFRAGWQKT